MARITQGDQVFLRIVAEGTPEADMVNLEILQRSTSLAAPAVASGKTWAPGAPVRASLATYSSKFTKFTKFTESPQLGVLIRPNYFRDEL